MATKEFRSGSWSVYWRHAGKKQRTTWDDEDDAIQAKAIAEARHHQVSREEMYDLVFGTDSDDDDTSPTLREWSKIWLDSRTRITPGTTSTYRRQFDSEILPVMGGKRLSQIEGTDVARFIKTLRTCDCADGKRGLRCRRNRSGGHGLSAATTDRYYSALFACLAFAVREKKLDDNPAKRTDYIRDLISHDDTGDDGDGHVYLTPAEYALILDAARPDARAFVEFLAGTGARFSEAAAMDHRSVKLTGEPKTVTIRRAWKSGRQEGSDTRWYLGATKGRSRRTIEIDDDLAELLKPLVKDQPGDAFLFRSPEGGHIIYRNFYERRWVPAVLAAMRCADHPPAPRGRRVEPGELTGPLCGDNGGTRDKGGQCGAKVVDGWDRCRTHAGPAPDAVSDCDCPVRLRKRATPHDLRHTHAAWLFSAGVPPLEISRRLGHKQLATTSEIYGGLMPDTQRASVAAIAAAKRKARKARKARPAAPGGA